MDGECEQRELLDTQLYLINNIMTDQNINEDNKSQAKIAKQNLIMQYCCRTNNCNNPKTAQLIKKAVKNHYDLSAMYKILNVKIEENSTEVSITSSISDSTSIKTTSMTTTWVTKTSTIITSTIKTTEESNKTSTSLHMVIIIIILSVILVIFFWI
jgi:hypothetical protein